MPPLQRHVPHQHLTSRKMFGHPLSGSACFSFQSCGIDLEGCRPRWTSMGSVTLHGTWSFPRTRAHERCRWASPAPLCFLRTRSLRAAFSTNPLIASPRRQPTSRMKATEDLELVALQLLLPVVLEGSQDTISRLSLSFAVVFLLVLCSANPFEVSAASRSFCRESPGQHPGGMTKMRDATRPACC